MADALTEALLILKEDSPPTTDPDVLSAAGQYAELVEHISTWATNEAYVPTEGQHRSWAQRLADGQAHRVSVPPRTLEYFAHGPEPQRTQSVDQHVDTRLDGSREP